MKSFTERRRFLKLYSGIRKWAAVIVAIIVGRFLYKLMDRKVIRSLKKDIFDFVESPEVQDYLETYLSIDISENQVEVKIRDSIISLKKNVLLANTPGAVLELSKILEHSLTYKINDSKIKNNLVSNIKKAYELQMINKKEKRNLDHFRIIRNKVVHTNEIKMDIGELRLILNRVLPIIKRILPIMSGEKNIENLR